MNDLSSDRLLKISTVAKLVDASAATIRRWIAHGRNGERLPVVRLPGGRVRVALSDLQAYLAKFNMTFAVPKKDEEGLRRHGLL